MESNWKSGIHLQTYEHLIFDKEAKHLQWKKESIFNQWCLHNRMLTHRRIKIDPYLSSCIKLKSKWNKNLNLNLGTLKLIEEEVGNCLEHISTGHNFLNLAQVAKTLRVIINKWDILKLKIFCKAEDTVIRQISSLQNGKKSSPTPYQTEDWSPKYIKNSRNWSLKEQIIQKNGVQI